MPYISHTPSEIEEMLKVIGVVSIEELFKDIPHQVRFNNFDNLPSGTDELELIRIFDRLAKANTPLDEFISFLGGGIYDHYLPAPLKHIINRSEFYTSYTPYQPECSQGVLQAIYEYQSYICILTGMEVTNASLYDGATALSEAVLMGLRINKKERVIVVENIHPEYREVLKTYLKYHSYKIDTIPFNKEGRVDLNILKDALSSNVSSVVIQSPNFFGIIEEIEPIKSLCLKYSALLILVTNPFSLALLKEPSFLGVDIVCGDGQPLDGSLSLGGPTFGFLATRKEYIRQLPGRIVGRTKDSKGKPAYCLTLQAREQHIRREKATSNICSNESLNAIISAIYLSLLGKEGFKEVALYTLNITHYLYDSLKKLNQVEFPFNSCFFNEFVWCIPSTYKALKKLKKKKIIAGLPLKRFYPQLPQGILSTCTEKKRKEDIDLFIEELKKIL